MEERDAPSADQRIADHLGGGRAATFVEPPRFIADRGFTAYSRWSGRQITAGEEECGARGVAVAAHFAPASRPPRFPWGRGGLVELVISNQPWSLIRTDDE